MDSYSPTKSMEQIDFDEMLDVPNEYILFNELNEFDQRFTIVRGKKKGDPLRVAFIIKELFFQSNIHKPKKFRKKKNAPVLEFFEEIPYCSLRKDIL